MSAVQDISRSRMFGFGVGLALALTPSLWAGMAGAGGFTEPVMEPGVVEVVTVSPPVEREPVFSGNYGTGATVTGAALAAGADQVRGSDHDGGAATGRSATANGVFCFTLPAGQRGGKGPLALCQP